MFVPKILKICPTDGSDQLYIEWTTPDPSAKPVVIGYILAYRRSDLDLNYSSRTLIGRHVCSTVIPCSRVSQRYDVKISAFSFRQFGDFSSPITWSATDQDDANSNISNLLPRPDIRRISSTDNGHGIHIQWKIPWDVSFLIIEGFVIKYKRCGLDTAYKEKLVPGCEVRSHVISGVKRCTLYEVRMAACTSKERGRFSVSVIIRTGVTLPDSIKLKSSPVPHFTPKILKLSSTNDVPGIYLSWSVPDQSMYPPVLGYVIAYRKVKAYQFPYFKCYIKNSQTASHVINILRTSVPYEIKIAAFNACGVGSYTLPRILNFAQSKKDTKQKCSTNLALLVPTVKLKNKRLLTA